VSEETNDIRERLQEIARTISIMLPPETGFALLCFDFQPGGKIEYVSNGSREDVVKAMSEWIQKTDGGRYAKHLK
jgi:hypothetical protein